MFHILLSFFQHHISTLIFCTAKRLHCISLQKVDSLKDDEVQPKSLNSQSCIHPISIFPAAIFFHNKAFHFHKLFLAQKFSCEKFLPLFKKKHLHIKGGKLDYTSFSDTKVCLLSENSQKIMEGYQCVNRVLKTLQFAPSHELNRSYT